MLFAPVKTGRPTRPEFMHQPGDNAQYFGLRGALIYFSTSAGLIRKRKDRERLRRLSSSIFQIDIERFFRAVSVKFLSTVCFAQLFKNGALRHLRVISLYETQIVLRNRT